MDHMDPDGQTQTAWTVRYGGWLLLAAALLLVPIIYGSIHVTDRVDNQASVWLPQDYDATREYDWFVDLFGSDEIVLVSWDGCTINDERLEQFARFAEGKESAPVSKELAELVDRVSTGQRIVRSLEQPPIDLSAEAVAHRLQGVLIGPDYETTCALITLNDKGDEQRHQVVKLIERIAIDQLHIPQDQLRLSGDVVINVAIDEEGDRAVTQWLLPSAGIALVMAWVCLRSFKLAFIVFVLSQFCSLGLEAIIYYSGASMNLLLTLAPVLIYVLALSACVHVTNYFRDAVSEYSVERGPTIAVRQGWYPCLISALTTALGLISLGVSHVAPVRAFGFYGGLGVAAAFATVMCLLPAALSRLGGRKAGRRSTQKAWLRSIAVTTLRHRFAILCVAFVGMGLLAAGVTRIQTAVSPARFLPETSRWMRDANWFRDHIGPLSPYEVVIGIQRDADMSFGKRMRLVRDMQRRLHTMDSVGGSCSAATLAPNLGSSGMLGMGHATRILQDRKLLKHRDQFKRQRFLAEDDAYEWWRVSLRINRLGGEDLEGIATRIEDLARPVVDEVNANQNEVVLKFTGTVPLLFAAQRELLDSLTISFAAALFMITCVMMATLRSIRAGLVVMVPNVFPALVVFGAMGWLDLVVDVGAMMTASIALGIAVDDSLHFLAWFQRATARGASRRGGIIEAFQRCAPAMLHTTLIAGLGLSVFAFSSFQPVSRFGLLMAALLAAALVGDLTLLPAILASPMGRVFAKATKMDATPADPQPSQDQPTQPREELGVATPGN